MMNELARVFSSSGVRVPGTGYVYAYNPGGGRGPADAAAEPQEEGGGFGPLFEQASAKLELSESAKQHIKDASRAEVQTRESESRLSEEQKKQVDELAKRDREVKAHEGAHKAAAGGHAKGGAGYEYQVGPDGKQYAVGGHVDIDAGPVNGNPEATLAKAQAIRSAAMAPADPSGQDRAVAAAAAQMSAQARKDLIQEKTPEAREAGKPGKADGSEAESMAVDAEAPAEAAAAAPRPDSRVRDYGRAKPPAGAALNVFG